LVVARKYSSGKILSENSLLIPRIEPVTFLIGVRRNNNYVIGAHDCFLVNWSQYKIELFVWRR
jgi:hypothetical protein